LKKSAGGRDLFQENNSARWPRAWQIPDTGNIWKNSLRRRRDIDAKITRSARFIRFWRYDRQIKGWSENFSIDLGDAEKLFVSLP